MSDSPGDQWGQNVNGCFPGEQNATEQRLCSCKCVATLCLGRANDRWAEAALFHPFRLFQVLSFKGMEGQHSRRRLGNPDSRNGVDGGNYLSAKDETRLRIPCRLQESAFFPTKKSPPTNTRYQTAPWNLSLRASQVASACLFLWGGGSNDLTQRTQRLAGAWEKGGGGEETNRQKRARKPNKVRNGTRKTNTKMKRELAAHKKMRVREDEYKQIDAEA
jgi:hypothetical protein